MVCRCRGPLSASPRSHRRRRTRRARRSRRWPRRAGRGLARSGCRRNHHASAPRAEREAGDGLRRARRQAPSDDERGERHLDASRSARCRPTSTPMRSTWTALTVLDPRNTNTKMGYGGFGPVSVVEVPGRRPAVLRREAGAARDGAHPAVRLEDAWGSAGQCGSTRRPTTTRARAIPCSTSCTAPATSSPAGR